MIDPKTRKLVNPFNKGTAALKASFLAILALAFTMFTHQAITSIICGAYAYKTKMIPTYYKKSGPWGYAGIIYMMAILGLPYFFYDVFKNKAMKNGQDVDTPKNVLFWICTVFWILASILLSIGLIYFYIMLSQ